MPITADVDLTVKDISGLASVDAIASFLTRLGYRTECRQALPLAAFGLSPETTDAIRHMELLAEDPQQELRVIFVQLRSVTAKARNEIARNLGRRAADHMLILTKDFEAIEFVLIDKETRQNRGPTGPTVAIIPRTVTVDRKSAGLEQRRVLRRLTWTGSPTKTTMLPSMAGELLLPNAVDTVKAD